MGVNRIEGHHGRCAAVPAVFAEIPAAVSDRKGAWRDNVFVERLWRSVKYEEVYLRAYDSVGEARIVPLGVV
jgi:putative transposase